MLLKVVFYRQVSSYLRALLKVSIVNINTHLSLFLLAQCQPGQTNLNLRSLIESLIIVCNTVQYDSESHFNKLTVPSIDLVKYFQKKRILLKIPAVLVQKGSIVEDMY